MLFNPILLSISKQFGKTYKAKYTWWSKKRFGNNWKHCIGRSNINKVITLAGLWFTLALPFPYRAYTVANHMLHAKFKIPCQAARQYGQEQILHALLFLLSFLPLPSSWHICQFLTYSHLKENLKNNTPPPPIPPTNTWKNWKIKDHPQTSLYF